jgi:S1-C subfamily serine protease
MLPRPPALCPVLAVAVVLGASAALGACGDEEKPFSEEALIKDATPSVAQINVQKGDNVSGGSGVVLDAKQALVLTNAHVVAGASALRARVGDDPDTEGPARVVALAPCEDLAVIQLTERPAGLEAMPLGSSSGVKLGQHVTALGYPVSFDETPTIVATDGTVSSLDVAAEPDPSLPRYESTIQHQAPINPGNSGGPLIDDDGRLVGMNTLGNTVQNDRPVQGQGYAITVDRIKTFLPDLKAGTSTADAGWSLVPLSAVPVIEVFATDPAWKADGRAELGAKTAAEIERRGIDGLFVAGTSTGSPADDVDIASGDIVTSIEGSSVTTFEDTCKILESSAPGEKLRVRGRYLNSAPSYRKVLNPWSAGMVLEEDQEEAR